MSLNYWLAVLAYLVPTFPLGYFWHLSTFKKSYDELHIYRPDVVIPMGLASMLIQALLFAYLYPILFSTVPDDWEKGALGFFAIFGGLAWSLAVLPVAAKFKMASVQKFLILETAFTVLQYAITAPLIALAWRGARA